MALQNSGQISILDIVGEFGGSAPHALSEYYAAASGVPASGQLKISDFYGKSNIFYFTISGSANNVNLSTLATAAGWDGSAPVVVTIGSGVIIGSTSTSSPSMTISGFPSGVTLVNNGLILGRGGDGGGGRTCSSNTCSVSGYSGGNGGDAISLGNSVSITNNGTIGGGGGGGAGAGGSCNGPFSYGFLTTTGGGGGGGAGYQNSSGGGNSGWGGCVPASIVRNPANGSAGTNTTGGAGGLGGYHNTSYGPSVSGNGGAGGNLGQAGSAATARSGTAGAAGKAIDLNGYTATFIATGTVAGAVS